jgi:TonB family protein
LYSEDLALLSKDEITKPSPPVKKIVVTNNRKSEVKPEQKIDEKINHKIVIEEKKNISASNLPSRTPNETIHGYSDKKLTDKSYTEFQITLPVEVDRRGYSLDNSLITASFEKGIALSALPSFRGKGMEGFVEYVSKNIEYPEEARDNIIEGTVEVQFAVDVDGTVKEIEIKKRIHPLLDMEAYRLIKNSPKWIPGFVNGRPAKVYFRFPVNFRVD